LAAIAMVFLIGYSVEVLEEPRGMAAQVVHLVTAMCWGVFAVDYAVRLCLASNRWRWFYRHLLDLAIVVLPLIRPLRLVRLVILITVLQKAVGNAIRGRVVVYTAAGAANPPCGSTGPGPRGREPAVPRCAACSHRRR
jgi:voltage-gated potassium channel